MFSICSIGTVNNLYNSFVSLQENNEQTKLSSDLSYYSILSSSRNSIKSSLTNQNLSKSIPNIKINYSKSFEELIGNSDQNFEEKVQLLEDGSEIKTVFDTKENLNSDEKVEAICDQNEITAIDSKSETSNDLSRWGNECCDCCCYCWTYINDMIDLYNQFNGCLKYYWNSCNCSGDN